MAHPLASPQPHPVHRVSEDAAGWRRMQNRFFNSLPDISGAPEADAVAFPVP